MSFVVLLFFAVCAIPCVASCLFDQRLLLRISVSSTTICIGFPLLATLDADYRAAAQNVASADLSLRCFPGLVISCGRVQCVSRCPKRVSVRHRADHHTGLYCLNMGHLLVQG